jgi:hypothetical protein
MSGRTRYLPGVIRFVAVVETCQEMPGDARRRPKTPGSVSVEQTTSFHPGKLHVIEH